MKRLVSIYLVFFLFACSNNKSPLDVKALENMPEEFDMNSEAFEYETIATQKLQDYFDLIQLKENYPEFTEEVSSQLQTVVNDTMYMPRPTEKVSIKNLQQVDLVIISEAEKRLTLSFDMLSNNSVRKDTIIAIIKTNIINIDDTERVATKISFVKGDEIN